MAEITSQPLSAEELATLELLHQPDEVWPDSPPYCRAASVDACAQGQDWPCLTARAVDEIKRLRGEAAADEALIDELDRPFFDR